MTTKQQPPEGIFFGKDIPNDWQKIIEREKTIREQHIADIENAARHSFESGAWSKHQPVRILMSKVLPDIIDAVKCLIAAVDIDRRAKWNKRWIQRLSEENYEGYCYLALVTMLDEASRTASVSHCLAQIHSVCMEEAQVRFWRSANAKFFTYVYKQQQKNSHERRWQKAGLTVAMNRYAEGYYDADHTKHPEAQWEQWPNEYKVFISKMLFDIIMQVTPLFEKTRAQYNGHRKLKELAYKLMPSKQLLEWVGNADAKLGLRGGFYLPLPAPPRDWTTTQDGGFWTVYGGKLRLVKNRNEAYQEEILERTDDLKTVFNAVNAAQHTAWRINVKVFNVLRDLIHEGKEQAGLPSADDIPLPNCPRCGATIEEGVDHECFHDAEVLETWKGLAKAMHRKNAKAKGQRLRLGISLEIAEMLLDDKEFYYVYQCDFRGRLYPTANLTPQGTDWEKGILEFAHGVPLGEHGAKWLAVHVANCWGEDKSDYDMRVKWTKDNTGWILDCAKDPLVHREWTEADSPFMFLAACFEWAGYCAEGDTYMSHIPVGLDGSCSGIQHYSAMLRDEVGALATNVKMTPGQTRKSDIYGMVADKVKEQMLEDLTGPDPDKARYANFTLSHDLMDRKITKRAVMTLPYGSTFQSAKEYVSDAINERPDFMHMPENDQKPYLAYVSKTVWECIPKVVQGARQGMDYLKSLARLACKAGTPVAWQTPTGFLVQQNYYLFDSKRIETMLGGRIAIQDGKRYWQSGSQRVHFNVVADSGYIDKAKQVSGIAPNFVHSMDASHLMFSVEAAQQQGIDSFALVHDSLGTHAGRTEEFSKILIEQFYRLYTQFKPLDTFIEQLKPLVADDDLDKIKVPPYINTLCPEDILSAKFLFS